MSARDIAEAGAIYAAIWLYTGLAIGAAAGESWPEIVARLYFTGAIDALGFAVFVARRIGGAK